jgi:hypothetical protein
MRNARMPALAFLAGVAVQWLDIPIPEAGILGLLAISTALWAWANWREYRER